MLRIIHIFQPDVLVFLTSNGDDYVFHPLNDSELRRSNRHNWRRQTDGQFARGFATQRGVDVNLAPITFCSPPTPHFAPSLPLPYPKYGLPPHTDAQI